MNTRRLVLLLALAGAGCDRSPPAPQPPASAAPAPTPSPSRTGPCGALDAEACRVLGHAHARFGAGPFNPLLSLELFEDACRLGNMVACFDAADACSQRHEHVAGADPRRISACAGEDGVECFMPTDNARAGALYVRACDANVASACSWGGDLFLSNYEGIPRDEPRATRLLERACEADEPHGCYLLAALIGGDHQGPKDLVRAASLDDKACALGDRDGCFFAGENYERGEGVAKDPATAVARYKAICDRGFDPLCCTHLADHYVAGDGVAKDPARAAAIYQQHCGDGKTRGGVSCRNLAALYEHGDGVEKDLARAGALYLQACGTLDPTACPDAKRLGAHR